MLAASGRVSTLSRKAKIRPKCYVHPSAALWRRNCHTCSLGYTETNIGKDAPSVFPESLLQKRREDLLSRLSHVNENSGTSHDYGRDEVDRAKSSEAQELFSRLSGQ
jgi:hypothetical protein